jgi:hypothetical protein
MQILFVSVAPSYYLTAGIMIKIMIKMEIIYIYIYRGTNTAGGIRHADHVAPSIRTSWQSLRRQAAVARSV